MTKDDLGIAPEYQVPDELWEHIKPLLPPGKQKKKSGRPRMDDRQAVAAIFYLLRTGCQWKALPRSLGATSTVHDGGFCISPKKAYFGDQTTRKCTATG